MARMTLLEKIGQMTQVDVKSLLAGAVRQFGIGSVLSGGGGNPTPNNPETWAEMVRRVQAEALESRLGIPLLYGVDAVHGHSNLRGATIFPHNVGLGATRDSDLVERIGRVTASELLATNVNWTFAPAVSVPQDIRWGRTFEGFSEDSELVSSLGAAFIRGLNGEAGSGNGDRRPVLSSPKHFVGDGGTAWGSTRSYEWIQDRWKSDVADRWQLDQGDLRSDIGALRRVHLRPYAEAIAAGALSIMVSYSSWNGLKLHAHRYLLTDVLKGEMAFGGFLVSDWFGVSQLDRDFERAVGLSINAGLDMVMVPFEYERFIRAVEVGVETGFIPASRIDDACGRILRVKAALGLFNHPFGDESLLGRVGCESHRAVAREAVSKSQVLLKNEGAALPMSPNISRLLIAGAAANDIGLQCGGWTIEWQGDRGAITPGTTLLQGITETVAPETAITYRPAGDFEHEQGDVGIVVLSEPPYCEGEGDTDDLSLSADEVALVRRTRRHTKVLVLVIYSGRPRIIGDVLGVCDAIVASWLPGTEARGISDVLFGREPFTGRLPYTWPANMDQLRSPNGSAPLFALSHGLTTARWDDLDPAHEGVA
ncbi:MAG TPA: glycoside hydrolase family 3 protein [Candidatus Dormibacteraeota bacterium]|nr:glycoside hydrolase family 3 protein [Candidatus Dormibacteraeota bacterium]